MANRRLELDEREIEMIAEWLITQPWAKVNNTMVKIQQQMNNPEFQGEIAALQAKVKELTPPSTSGQAPH